jgi:hypothetical protein
LDDPQQLNDAALRSFKKKFKMNYKILRATYQVVRDYFGMNQPSIPTLFVVSRDGFIADKQLGYMPGAVEKSIKKHL